MILVRQIINTKQKAAVLVMDIPRGLITLKQETMIEPREPVYNEEGELVLGKFELPPDEELVTDSVNSNNEILTLDYGSLMNVKVVA